jgi:hypothetical protein
VGYLYICIPIKLPKVNNRPLSENLPNLVNTHVAKLWGWRGITDHRRKKSLSRLLLAFDRTFLLFPWGPIGLSRFCFMAVWLMDWLTTACGYEWPKERRFFSSTHIHTYIHTYSYDRANNFVIEEIGDGSTATTELIIFSCHVHIVNQAHASRNNVLSSDFSVEWQKARYLHTYLQWIYIPD